MFRQFFCSALLLATVGLGAMASKQDIPVAEQLVFAGGQLQDGNANIKAFEKPALSDLLTIDHSLSVFYDYLRQSQSLVKRLTLHTPTTIFAPKDAAILSLHRKPHQGPVADSDSLDGLSEEDEDKAMLAYLEEWMQAHIVDGADFELKAGTRLTTLAGEEHTLALEERTDAGQEDWEKVVIQQGGAIILEVKEARDGRIYVIDRVLQ